MSKIFIELPSLLRQVIESQPVADGDLEIEANTLEEAFTKIQKQFPKLSVHIFDEQGSLREHVLCFLNDENTRWLEDQQKQLNFGDRLLIMQAVSGG